MLYRKTAVITHILNTKESPTVFKEESAISIVYYYCASINLKKLPGSSSNRLGKVTKFAENIEKICIIKSPKYVPILFFVPDISTGEAVSTI